MTPVEVGDREVVVASITDVVSAMVVVSAVVISVFPEVTSVFKDDEIALDDSLLVETSEPEVTVSDTLVSDGRVRKLRVESITVLVTPEL